MKLTRLFLITIILCINFLIVCSLHAATYYPSYYPNIGWLSYDGEAYAESYFAWMNPGAWLVSDPGYEHDFNVSPLYFYKCTSVTNLPSGYDDCNTAGVGDSKKWAFTFGTFHAKKIQPKHWYWGAWDFKLTGWYKGTFSLSGQENQHYFCPWDWNWCMNGLRSEFFNITGGELKWFKKFDQWWWNPGTPPHPPAPYTPPFYNPPHPTNPPPPQPSSPININLYVISKSQTGTNRTEVHILDGANKFRSWLLHTGTPLEMTGDNFKFLIADYNQDGSPDLVIIKKSDTGTNRTEVHILSGASNFQTWLLHTGTPLEMTWSNFDFAMGDYNRDGVPDLVIIKKSDTAGRTEVHVLNGANNFQSWLLHIATPLEMTWDNFDFTMGDYNRDGVPDLVIIKKSDTAGRTEVHILSGASKFQSWLLHTGTPLEMTWDNFDFTMGDYNRDGVPDLVIIKKSYTGTNSTEVHVLSGANNFQSWLLHTGTPLHQTGNTFEFGMSSN